MQLLLLLFNLVSRSLPTNGYSFSWINRAYFKSTKFIDIILTSHSYSIISNCSLPQTYKFTNIFDKSSRPFLFLNCPISLFLQKCTILYALLLFLQLYYSLSVQLQHSLIFQIQTIELTLQILVKLRHLLLPMFCNFNLFFNQVFFFEENIFSFPHSFNLFLQNPDRIF